MTQKISNMISLMLRIYKVDHVESAEVSTGLRSLGRGSMERRGSDDDDS